MNKAILIIFLAALSSCDADHTPPKPRPQLFANKKYCIDACLRAEFAIFQSQGHEWGAGASSMGGLSQRQIFDRVLRYCDDFYADEKCCRGDVGVTWENINTTHGVEYGACK